MIYIVQLIYVQPGKETLFHQFEELAIPIIARYNGQLLLRTRPTPETIINATIEHPYEIHLISFNTGNDFKQFMQDEERKQFLHLKEQSIREVLLIKGETI